MARARVLLGPAVGSENLETFPVAGCGCQTLEAHENHPSSNRPQSHASNHQYLSLPTAGVFQPTCPKRLGGLWTVLQPRGIHLAEACVLDGRQDCHPRCFPQQYMEKCLGLDLMCAHLYSTAGSFVQTSLMNLTNDEVVKTREVSTTLKTVSRASYRDSSLLAYTTWPQEH